MLNWDSLSETAVTAGNQPGAVSAISLPHTPPVDIGTAWFNSPHTSLPAQPPRVVLGYLKFCGICTELDSIPAPTANLL